MVFDCGRGENLSGPRRELGRLGGVVVRVSWDCSEDIGAALEVDKGCECGVRVGEEAVDVSWDCGENVSGPMDVDRGWECGVVVGGDVESVLSEAGVGRGCRGEIVFRECGVRGVGVEGGVWEGCDVGENGSMAVEAVCDCDEESFSGDFSGTGIS